MDKQVSHAEHISLKKNISMQGAELRMWKIRGRRRGKMKPKDGCVSAAAVLKKKEEKGGYEGIKMTLETKQSRTKDQGRDS